LLLELQLLVELSQLSRHSQISGDCGLFARRRRRALERQLGRRLAGVHAGKLLVRRRYAGRSWVSSPAAIRRDPPSTSNIV
jgi:hypothetical protein